MQMPETPAAPLPQITQKLIGIMDELAFLMEEEIPLVEQNRIEGHAAILKRKQELTLDYNATLKSLAGAGTGLSAAEKDMLKKRGKELEELAQRNAEALRLAHKATERLLNVMMDEVRKKQHNTSGYSAHGHIAAAEKSTSRPVACNQRV